MKQKKYTVLRLPKCLYEAMTQDLNRPHPYASERVGFFSTSTISAGEHFDIITITGYHVIPDDEYINDRSVGAKINTQAIRSAMERIIQTGNGCLHVHLHSHDGKPTPSGTDLKSLPDISRSFLNANPETVCGYLIISNDNFFCSVYEENKKNPVKVDQMTIIGNPMNFSFSDIFGKPSQSELFSRQSFLGKKSEALFTNVRIGIVGVGGGGSHIAQQLAHIGIINFSIFDEDHIELSNHNRLIGSWFTDVLAKVKKAKIISRLIKKISPKSKINEFQTRWQDNADELKKCDIVIGCIDSIEQRQQLEAICRRSLIPLIDIGMDVYSDPVHGYSMSGQIILSMPGMPCMSCFDFINEEKLTQEAKRYGDVGGRPQVVWPNGVLASTAVGIMVDLITGWSNVKDRKIYISYDGDLGHLTDHPKGIYCPENCIHYPLANTGDPIFKIL